MKKTPVVRDYMTANLHTLDPDTSIYDAVDFLLDHNISGAPVVDDGNNLVGLISEKDCLALLAKGNENQVPRVRVSDFMSKKVDTIYPDMDIFYAAGIFLKNAFRRYPVVDKNGLLVGQISRRDILRAIQENIKSDPTFNVKSAKIKSIEKEGLLNLKFPKEDVLNSKDEISIRRIKLENATRLGNIEHYKVKIIFEDEEGLKIVDTTVWATTEKYVLLKGGVRIPIHRISKIDLL